MKWTFKIFEPSRVRDLIILDLAVVLLVFACFAIIATQGKI